MPSEIIKKLIESENRSEEREKAARAEAKAIAQNAKLRSDEIIKTAEQECESTIINAKEEAAAAAEKLKNEREDNLDGLIASLRKSAEKNSDRVLKELMKALCSD